MKTLEGVGKGMEKVDGIGDFLFRARDPAALGHWCQDHLGVTLTSKSYAEAAWREEEGPTAFSPFPVESEYFEDSTRVWMINLRV